MAAPSFAAVVLEIASGLGSGRRVELRPGERLRVGRGVDTDLAIGDDPSVSRLHFTIQHAGAAVVLRDAGSRNGTLVNGARVSMRHLADGDTIVAGDTRFRVHMAPAAAPDLETRPMRQIGASGGIARDYERALADEDLGVREEALLAAAATRQPWLLDHLRRRAASPSPECWPELWMLAVLGEPRDLPLLLKAAEERSLGPRRISLLGTFGHPGGVDLILRSMDDEDPRTAHEAGRAYARITGVDVADPGRGAAAHRDDRDSEVEDDGAPAPTVRPDPKRAAETWQEMRSGIERCSRLCRGLDVSGVPEEAALDAMDLPARSEALMRLPGGA